MRDLDHPAKIKAVMIEHLLLQLLVAMICLGPNHTVEHGLHFTGQCLGSSGLLFVSSCFFCDRTQSRIESRSAQHSACAANNAWSGDKALVSALFQEFVLTVVDDEQVRLITDEFFHQHCNAIT